MIAAISVAAILAIGMEVILASASPRRREILARMIPSFRVVASDGEEIYDSAWEPVRIVECLARQKAENVWKKYPSALVLGADTIVYASGMVLGKPKDAEDAKRMLRLLSGKTHAVYTGYCLRGPDVDVSGSVKTDVQFNLLSEALIEEYVASGSPMDKAGAYGIQDDRRLVREICGSYTNVVGFPEEEIRRCLAEIGIQL